MAQTEISTFSGKTAMTNQHLILALIVAAQAAAQTPVAPTLEPVGKPRGVNWSDYNIANSFEIGYRWSTVAGRDSRFCHDRAAEISITCKGR